MGKPTGFMEYTRQVWTEEPVAERIKHFREFHKEIPYTNLRTQAARCMDCGVPWCHSHGCPLGNLIPDWNEMVWEDRLAEALELLHHTNNFPEFTGRVCPAPCEKACTLSLNNDPVSIKLIECEIVDRGFAAGLILPRPPGVKTGKMVAVIGSGPAGLAAAQQLGRAGHSVTVFERDEEPGGLLRFGIPDFKLEKRLIRRRIDQMEAEGVVFECGVDAGEDISANYLRRHFDAILLACGSKTPRDLEIPGRNLPGVHLAMEFLAQNNRLVAGLPVDADNRIPAQGKHVVVIGGGDTGSDCVGTSIRQGAAHVLQIEVLPKPRQHDGTNNPSWPDWPNILRTSTSHEEGCERRWGISTKEFRGTGRVSEIVIEEVDWKFEPGKAPVMTARPGTEAVIKADLVLLAMGFLHIEHGRLVRELGVELDGRGNVRCDTSGASSVPGVFTAGDSALGASLVVRAIATGRKAAIGIDRFLSGESMLPDTSLLW
ncbi:MAG TPA: glutamate synthase subunit beta [Spirochaetota bacterium]|nr:glutamate synthase subunit beta [Spirochaetota bacterium]